MHPPTEDPVRIQDDDYSCGACAILNALEAIGVKVSLEQVERLAGTTREGTDEIGIKDALDALGLESSVVAWDSANALAVRGDWFFATILRGAAQGQPAIVYSKPREHWFAAIGAIGDRLVVFDSDNTKANVAVNGVHVVDRDGLLQLTGPQLYALLVDASQASRQVA